MLRIQGFVHASDRLAALVYDLPTRETPAVDVAADLADGRHAMWTNSPAEGLDKPEWSIVHRDEDAEAGALIERARSAGPAAGREPIAVEQLKEHVERSDAREMDWRVQRGGFGPDEVRRAEIASAIRHPPSAIRPQSAYSHTVTSRCFTPQSSAISWVG